jgi:hypothetical protein
VGLHKKKVQCQKRDVMIGAERTRFGDALLLTLKIELRPGVK